MTKILYKRTNTGAIQQWSIEINPDNKAQYRAISGQVNGKLTKSKWKDAVGKNTGKTNETTAEEQAILEVQSTYKKRLKKGYHENIDDIDNETFFQPMTAGTYGKVKFEFPVYCQPKLDGMRCIAKADGLYTRAGERIVSCPHIEEELTELFESNPDAVIDGELYNHTYKDDFNTIISNTKKTKPTEEHLKQSKDIIQYHIYDFYSEDKPFVDRFFLIKELLSPSKSIVFVPTVKCLSQGALDFKYDEYLKVGYEGQMIRKNSVYEKKRSKNLIKRKETFSEEYELIDILDGKGNYKGIAKKALLKREDGVTFKAGITGTQEDNIEILKNKADYIGTMTTVVFEMYTPAGIPRFGRIKEWNRTDNIKGNK
jgi:DNA ligase-1